MRLALQLLALLLTLDSVAWAASGTLDSTFGPNHIGKVVTLVPGQGKADAVLIQNDHKIVAGGTNEDNAILVRYLENGTLDDGFADGSGSDS